MDPVLNIDRLTLEFPIYGGAVRALDAVSITVRPGEIVGVVGESGCGKSVTAMTTLRLIPDDRYRVIGGSITLLGVDMLSAGEKALATIRGARASMIFQEPLTALNPTRRVGDQMVEVIRAHQRISAAAATARATRLLSEMRIADAAEVLRRYPFELSGGMRQRVVIALAFANDPAIVIADEPTTALDVTVQRQVLLLLRQRSRDVGAAVLLITHDMGVVSEYTERVYVMYAGRVVESGPTAAVLGDPAHPYTRALLAGLPGSVAPKAVLQSIPGRVPDLRRVPDGCAFAPRCGQAMACCRQAPPLVAIPSPDGPVPRFAACWLPAAEAAS
ncbi:MAG: ABC transporter ATP-binding protein [Azospirillaceae bacterium]|nr:ABC transporter ATP-binding protein [Azospirillaceae bacterium]